MRTALPQGAGYARNARFQSAVPSENGCIPRNHLLHFSNIVEAAYVHENSQT